MSEEQTKEQNGARSFEERVFARFDVLDARFNDMDAQFNNMDARLTTLEEKVEARLYDTRPIWEAVQIELRRISKNLEQVVIDLHATRADYTVLDKRLTQLESRTQ